MKSWAEKHLQALPWTKERFLTVDILISRVADKVSYMLQKGCPNIPRLLLTETLYHGSFQKSWHLSVGCHHFHVFHLLYWTYQWWCKVGTLRNVPTVSVNNCVGEGYLENVTSNLPPSPLRAWLFSLWLHVGQKRAVAASDSFNKLVARTVRIITPVYMEVHTYQRLHSMEQSRLLSAEKHSLPSTVFIRKEGPGLLFVPLFCDNNIVKEAKWNTLGLIFEVLGNLILCFLARAFPALENVSIFFYSPWPRVLIILSSSLIFPSELHTVSFSFSCSWKELLSTGCLFSASELHLKRLARHGAARKQWSRARRLGSEVASMVLIPDPFPGGWCWARGP